MSAKHEVDQFNKAHPIGTPVFAYRGLMGDESRKLDTKTRSPAWVLGGHSAVVMVDGQSGCVAVSHVVVKK